MKSEFELIDAFAKSARRKGTRPRGVVVDIGDDAAVLRFSAREDVVVTADAMVEGRHFQRAWFSGQELGWRLAAVNMSDLAAMGALPRFAMVSLALPASLPPDYAEAIERGIAEHLGEYDAAIVGGNVTSIEGPLACDLTLIGTCARSRAWRRFAKPGDAIVVAGELGAAAVGLAHLKEGPARDALVRAYKRPVPRLDVVKALAKSTSVRGAIDVSDGLSSDLIHVCELNRLGCDLEAGALPIPDGVRSFCTSRNLDPIEWSLHAGDDYALVLAVPAQRAGLVCRTIEKAGAVASVVGHFTSRRGVYQIAGAQGMDTFEPGGWDHFRR